MKKKDQLQSLHSYIEKVNEYAVDNYKDLNLLIKKVNEIISTYNHDIKYLNQYIEALKFLMWFDWNKLSSQKLINEAKNKLIEDLSMSDNCLGLYYNIDKFEIEKNSSHSLGIINPETTFNTGYNFSINDDICFQRVPNIEVKEPKHEYKDYVKAVVANPNNYDKETICKVVNYLKQIIETNKTLQKYDV